MHSRIRLMLLAIILLALGSSLGVAACNIWPRPQTQLAIASAAEFLPDPLHAGAELATLELSLKPGKTPKVMVYTAGIGEISRQFAYRAADGQNRYLVEIKLLEGLKAGSYAVPVTLIDQRGREARINPRLVIKPRPQSAEPIITSSAGRKAFDALLPQARLSGNRFSFLDDGPQAFGTWVKIIAGAKQQINIQTYFLESDGLSSVIIDLLKRKSESGVEVNLILCRYSQLGKAPIIPLALKGSGINLIMAGDIGFPHEPGGPSLAWINKMHDDYRIFNALPKDAPLLEWTKDSDGTMIDFALHEKMLIVDGQTAIVGGRNISDCYFWWWQDLDLLIEGPLAKAVQANFKENWAEFKGKPILSPESALSYQPFKDGSTARLVCSSPWKGEYYNLDMLCTAIDLAREHVYLTSQYLALPPKLSQRLAAAAARGVDVRILTNSAETGQEVGRGLCHYVSLNYYRELLSYGVRLYEYHGPLRRERFRPYYHAKQFMVDGRWLAVGSFNLSIRSSYIESELMVAIEDRELAARRERTFIEMLARAAREVQPADLAFMENAAGRRMQLAKRIEILY